MFFLILFTTELHTGKNKKSRTLDVKDFRLRNLIRYTIHENEAGEISSLFLLLKPLSDQIKA